MSAKADFSDLTTRTISAIVMLAIAGFTLWQGGLAFQYLLIVLAGLMAWELSQMHDTRKWLPILSGAFVAAVVYISFFPIGISPTALTVLKLAPCLLISGLHVEKTRFTVFLGLLVFMAATTDLGTFRIEQGFVLTIWLLLCIIASDVGGYFAGKIFGGPKLWVRISPKKTWSGTIGGWALAAIVGLCIVIFTAQPWVLVPASILVAIAAQAGDLLESAVKRRAGVKDSSNLIPGHGGLLDRFDGVLGVCFLLGLAGLLGVY
ncbi:phosphatidate cytidylyltransferase [Amylibacter sp. SFDW26]|uniref:phosphatidate cytidylyltransferase n=1 Tax=Amylibacter sp. SFDW26 TaxID=2652722 RepID=UPI001261F970|nr:phosphatidate cytidylyltransferase [Amylibacter sp. SFDW26]KAB7615879.1 phosphatidate cytidylyltransferase [Amylibacter sp. SFDW26]